MEVIHSRRTTFVLVGLSILLLVTLMCIAVTAQDSKAGPLVGRNCRSGCGVSTYASGDGSPPSDVGGTWYWLRSPEEEKRVVSATFNRFCIRCHGVDGRGVWDIPGVPDFTNTRWQASRSDGQIARIIVEGRGAVMPPFRGTLGLEEAWAMSRYLRTFVPGTEVSRPDLGTPEKPSGATPVPELKPPAVSPK